MVAVGVCDYHGETVAEASVSMGQGGRVRVRARARGGVAGGVGTTGDGDPSTGSGFERLSRERLRERLAHKRTCPGFPLQRERR